jgi:glutathione S-transferase
VFVYAPRKPADALEVHAMSLTLYMHPLASYCWKVLIALYENETPFEPRLVDLGDPVAREQFHALWPIGKFPVLHDATRDALVPESAIILEYLAQHHPGPRELVPRDPDRARQCRLRERFFDLYVHEPMQQIVGDRLRPEGAHDPFGVEQARARLRVAYAMIEREMADATWAFGPDFSAADCAAAPALYYANLVAPFVDTHPNVAAYLRRLEARPSFARVLAEAEPYFAMFPK